MKQNAIKADQEFPEGRFLYEHEGQMVLAYSYTNPNTKQTETRAITRNSFTTLSNGISGFPPLVKIMKRGMNKNVGLLFVWVDNSGVMHWRIGELLGQGTFEDINWKPYTQVPGRKNKGLGSKDDEYQQGIFEASKRWVEFLEQKEYKLLFPEDEVVANQIYYKRSNSSHILGGKIKVPQCMLALKFDIDKLPSTGVIVDPKYDGGRNLATFNSGQVHFYTRKKKIVDCLDNLKPQVMVVFMVMQEYLGKDINLPDGQTCIYWLDGELYRHGWKLQKTMSAIRRSVNQSNLSTEIVYMVYDLIDGLVKDVKSNAGQRRMFLTKVFNDDRVKNLPNIKLTPYKVCIEYPEIVGYFDKLIKLGYEGAIIRTIDGMYLGHSSKRTEAMMKMKDFIDEEAWVMDIVPATGTHIGCAKYILNSKPDGSGVEYGAVPAGDGIGDLESRRRQLQNKELFIGSCVTVKYTEKSDDGIPKYANIILFNRDDLPL